MKRALVLVVALASGCARDVSDAKLIEMSREAERTGAALQRAEHAGPGIVAGAEGTARFATPVFAAFSAERALETTAFADRFYREPANDGFEAVVDRVVADLRAAGFGTNERLLLEVIETPLDDPSWTPVSGSLVLVADGKPERSLHAFKAPEDRDRTMLPRNAPTAHVEGRVVESIDAIEPGCVLLTAQGLRSKLLDEARAKGAVLVMSSELATFNVDPKKGGERHLDAIGYRHVAYPTNVPVVQISPRSAAVLQRALAADRNARVRFDCETKFVARPLRTVVATVVGAKLPDECVALAAHIQEPGACDNASGVGTLLEGAVTTARLLGGGELRQPARSVCFVFGNEMEQSRVFLAHTQRRCIAAIAADMTGESSEKTSAIALLERAPDPGAVKALPPDQHTAWMHGDGPTSEASEIVPSGLALIARCALVDVGALQSGWKTNEHPYEGGSDHSVYLQSGIPAVLFWHFTDFAYHTSLDRLEHVDALEMRRTGAALITTALAVADARPTDLERYLKSLMAEAKVRTNACDDAHDAEALQQWRAWTTGARMWLRDLCLPQPVSPTKPKENS